MLERHNPPEPDACDVCRYAIDNGVDVEHEHAMTRLAFMLLDEALAAMGGGPARLSGLAVSTFPPIDVGPIQRLEPRHYYWALFHSPTLQIVLKEGSA